MSQIVSNGWSVLQMLCMMTQFCRR